MATAEIEESKTEKWKQALVGPLSPDFLRLSNPREIQESADRQAAIALYQNQQVASPYMAPNVVGRLSITVAQAKLVRNYGLTRMDPYVRVRVGHFVYETQTDTNGGKNPRWNRAIHCQLSSGVENIFVEVYDECSFKMDELIAWAEIKIPRTVMNGETNEEWHPLSGKQGDFLEGSIDLVLSFTQASQVPAYTYPAVQPMMVWPNVSNHPLPVYIAPNQPQVAPPVMHQAPPQMSQQMQSHQLQQPQQADAPPPAPVPMTEEDLKQMREMFPDVDPNVIKTVFEASNGDKARTINIVLQLTENN